MGDFKIQKNILTKTRSENSS